MIQKKILKNSYTRSIQFYNYNFFQVKRACRSARNVRLICYRKTTRDRARLAILLV